MAEYCKMLLIPDAHSAPNESLRRFEWLGEFILTEMPDVIIDIGDWYDMESLCSYDKGTKSFEGRRYKADIQAGKEAERLSFGRIVEYNDTCTRNKKKKYNPTILRTRGNHEERINRAVERQAELDGIIGIADTISSLDLNFINVPFLKTCIIHDIAFSHYFVSGIMGRPVASASALLAKHHMSTVMGHSHTKDWSGGVKADGTRMQGLICGSYHDPDHSSSFASEQAESIWWSGLHVFRDVYKGDYDREEYSVERLQRLMEGSAYGKASKAVEAA